MGSVCWAVAVGGCSRCADSCLLTQHLLRHPRARPPSREPQLGPTRRCPWRLAAAAPTTTAEVEAADIHPGRTEYRSPQCKQRCTRGNFCNKIVKIVMK